MLLTTVDNEWFISIVFMTDFSLQISHWPMQDTRDTALPTQRCHELANLRHMLSRQQDSSDDP